MLKSISLLIVTLSMVSIFSTAQADIAGPVARCSIKANKMSGATLGVLLSVGGLETDNATITCKEPGKKAVSKQAAVIIEGIGAGVGLTIYKSFRLESIMLGFTSPDDLFGRYNFGVKAGVNLIEVEGGVITTASLDNGVSLKMGLYGAKAYGLAVSAQAISMRVMTPKQYKKLVEKRKAQQENNK